jgi:two-component system, chemotaxis family, protein-glutamate methylesterase/glutaminase
MIPITVLVASTSPVNRGRIAKMMSAVPGLDVVAITADLSETFTLAEARKPDIVVVSDEFRHSAEFNAMKPLFYALDARWIFVGATVPSLTTTQMHGVSGRVFDEPLLDMTMSPEIVYALVRQAMSIARTNDLRARPHPGPDAQAVYDRVVVIGSSTGGVDALLTILSEFPADCPPTAIVQHTGRGFSDSLIRLLKRRCKPQVVAAHDGVTLKHGMICVAAGTQEHLNLHRSGTLRCQTRPGAPISGHVPSIDALFRSALPMAPHVVGVILTGMGQDGAAGLLELRHAGCITLAQDEASSVVYGMPKAAWEIGAVQQRLPIQKIGAEILRACMVSSATGAEADKRLAMW